MKIETRAVRKSFGTPPVEILHGIDLSIASGEFVALTGRSGSGKSTLLYVLSTLDRPTSGEVLFDGTPSHLFNRQEVHAFRNQKLGFVFQFHYLLPELTAIENILLPAMKAGDQKARTARALSLLKSFGIEAQQNRLPGQLSGGEQQRVAIARSLIMNPRVLFADEPTGNLDTANGEIVMNHLRMINQEEGTTIVLITHELDFARLADRQIRMVDGKILNEKN